VISFSDAETRALYEILRGRFEPGFRGWIDLDDPEARQLYHELRARFERISPDPGPGLFMHTAPDGTDPACPGHLDVDLHGKKRVHWHGTGWCPQGYRR
jgi:hypothetical protein